jgi:hypothetical protein
MFKTNLNARWSGCEWIYDSWLQTEQLRDINSASYLPRQPSLMQQCRWQAVNSDISQENNGPFIKKIASALSNKCSQNNEYYISNPWSSVTCYLHSAKTVVEISATTQRTVQSTWCVKHCQVIAANWHSPEHNWSRDRSIDQSTINQPTNHKHMKYTIKPINQSTNHKHTKYTIEPINQSQTYEIHYQTWHFNLTQHYASCFSSHKPSLGTSYYNLKNVSTF